MEAQASTAPSHGEYGSRSGSEPPMDLRLCLRRLHGKSVVASPMPVPPEGVVVGSDGGPVALADSLHVAARHALVRSALAGEEGAWRIEPGNKAMLLVVNDAPVVWGESCALRHGDQVEVGFARFGVSLETRSAESSVAFAGLTGLGTGLAATSPLVPADDGPWNEPEPVTDKTELSTDETPSFMPLLLEPEPEPAQPAAVPPEPLAAEDAAEPEACPSEAELLAAMLAESMGTGVGEPLGGDVLAAVVREAEPPQSAPAPDDILAELAAESERALARGGLGMSGVFSYSGSQFGALTGASSPALDEPDPFQAGAAMVSVEEIVEGPLTIDDVLERLRSQTAADSRADPLGMLTATSDHAPQRLGTSPSPHPLDALVRVPDPLLLLAGMENQPMREPELAPVLHREHSATGMRSPYRAGAAHALSDDLQPSEQEEPWPPLPR